MDGSIHYSEDTNSYTAQLDFSTPLGTFSAPFTIYNSTFGSYNFQAHICTGGARSLVATACAPVWLHY